MAKREELIELSDSRYKVTSLKIFIISMNECIEALEKHNNPSCNEPEPGSPGLELSLVREIIS